MELLIKTKRVRLSKSKRMRMNQPPKVTTEAVVRVGQPEDEDGVMVLARLIHKEIGMFNIDEDKGLTQIRPALRKEHGIVGVIGKKDNLEGFILLRVSTNWYSPKPFLEEMCVFVHPDYRNAVDSRVRKLLDFSKKCSDELQMPLMIGVLSNQRTDAKVKFYQRTFGDPAGAFFIYGAKTGQSEEPDTRH